METNNQTPSDTKALFILHAFAHGRKTDLRTRTLTNYDFIVLMLALTGPFGLTEVRQLSQQWRGDARLDNYFGPHAGYTGSAFTGTALYLQGFGPASGHPRFAPLWWRSSQRSGNKRYANSLTLCGTARAKELLDQIVFPSA